MVHDSFFIRDNCCRFDEAGFFSFMSVNSIGSCFESAGKRQNCNQGYKFIVPIFSYRCASLP